MAACEFCRHFEGSKTELLARIRERIEANAGQVEGGESEGTLLVSTPLGPVRGSYAVSGSDIRVTVTHKPMLVPCSAIAAVIDRFVSSP